MTRTPGAASSFGAAVRSVAAAGAFSGGDIPAAPEQALLQSDVPSTGSWPRTDRSTL